MAGRAGPATEVGPVDLANGAVRAVLRTQWEGVPALRLDSPPGAGKTGVVERLAAQSLALQGERCIVATQTNEQSFDLVRRLAGRYRALSFVLFTRQELPLPPDLATLPNLAIVRRAQDFPTGPCVILANAAKWSWVDRIEPFDLLIVDEAFQLADQRFHQIAGLGRRIVLIGDPGQIPPIVTFEVERWRCDPAGPQVAAPRALSARHPGVLRLTLPVSRRLVPDTVDFVQPAFYPDLPFRAISAPGDRALIPTGWGSAPVDRAIDLAAAGASLIQIELPPRMTGPTDPEVADAILALIGRLLVRGARIREGEEVHPLDPAQIGVACAHVTQVNAVRERLARGMAGVLVETSDRFQGLERPVMIVHHPLSGRSDAGAFHLDAGRLCVMLSRHRVACFVVTRGGVEDLLRRYAPTGNRILGSDEDSEFDGWQAHLRIQRSLRERERVIRFEMP